MNKKTKENGITLVALVITIIVLLILAGVTISYVTNNGIINKTKLAMNDYENAHETKQEIIGEIDEYNKQEVDPEPVYDEKDAEDNIAPSDLFEYEIINDGSIASTYMQNLPTKTAKITGVNPKYIDIETKYGYYSPNWYYNIKYSGITDVLVIPYQVELDENGKVTNNGEMYKITEVDLSVKGNKEFSKYNGSSFPSIKKIIYPNTVEKIARNDEVKAGGDGVLNQPVKIILSNNLTSIENGAFSGAPIESIEIPEGVTSISDYAFFGCDLLKNIEIPNGVTSIGEYAFDYCYSLSTIKLPASVTSLDVGAFSMCYQLKEIVIPENIEYIGERAFQNWKSDQTIYFECSEEDSKNWDPNWKEDCDAKIVWDYSPNETTE